MKSKRLKRIALYLIDSLLSDYERIDKMLKNNDMFVYRFCILPIELITFRISLEEWKIEILSNRKNVDLKLIKILINVKSFLEREIFSNLSSLVDNYSFPKEFEIFFEVITDKYEEFQYETENVKIKKIEPFIVEIEKDGRKERINVINCEDILKLKKLLNDEAIKELEKYIILDSTFKLL
jgi:hypothetical protein